MARPQEDLLTGLVRAALALFGAGGVLLAAGLLSNPVGWTVIGVGTVTALAGMGYQWAFGMDEQEEFLQRVGVRRESW